MGARYGDEKPHYGVFFKAFHLRNAQPNPKVLSLVVRKVTNEMNNELLAPYMEEEVRKALFDIGDLKAPGPDGLHAIFDKRFWSMLG